MGAPVQIIRISFIAILCVSLSVFLSSCATPSSSCYLRSDEISDIRNDAESGNAESQYTMGSWYHHGDCLKQDFAKAMDWYQQSASQGNVDAQSSLGFLYDHHKNNMSKAIEWYKKAALQDDIRSMRILGVLYVNGTKVEKISTKEKSGLS